MAELSNPGAQVGFAERANYKRVVTLALRPDGVIDNLVERAMVNKSVSQGIGRGVAVVAAGLQSFDMHFGFCTKYFLCMGSLLSG